MMAPLGVPIDLLDRLVIIRTQVQYGGAPLVVQLAQYSVLPDNHILGSRGPPD